MRFAVCSLALVLVVALGSAQGKVQPVKAPTGPVKAPNIKPLPYFFEEPVDGYLKSFQWNELPPMWGAPVKGYEDLDRSIAGLIKADAIPGGSFAIIRNNEVVYMRGFGLTDLKSKAPFYPHVATRCGSITKFLTAVTALRLMQAGKLDLDANVQDYFTTKIGYDIGQGLTLDNRNRYKKWRIRDLMDMANGFPYNGTYLYKNLAAVIQAKQPLKRVEVLRGMLETTALNPPMVTQQYNNFAFQAMTEIVEHASGQKYEKAIRSYVLDPLGIPEAQIHFSKTQMSPFSDNRAPGEPHYYSFFEPTFDRFDGQPGQVSEAYGGLDMDALGGAGSVAFSAEGLAKLVTSVQRSQNSREPGILNLKTWKTITTPPEFVKATGASDTAFYAKGMQLRKTGKGWFIEHGALLQHACGDLKVFLDEKGNVIQTICLTNSYKKGFSWGPYQLAMVNACRANSK